MTHQHDGRPWLPEDELRELYHQEGNSQREIADHFDCSLRALQRAMNKYGIKTDKARNDPTKPPAHGFDKKSDVVGTEYEQVQTMIDGTAYRVSIHRLIAVAEGLLSPAEFFDPNKVVHHESGHGLDNRPENIEVMDRGDHQTHHLNERYS
jgi:hypothetical protein